MVLITKSVLDKFEEERKTGKNVITKNMAMNFDIEMNKKKNVQSGVSAAHVFGQEALYGTVPTVGGLGVGVATATAAAPLAAVPVVGPVLVLGAGLIGAIGGATLLEQAQSWALKAIKGEDVYTKMEQERQAEAQQHPWAAFGGSAAPQLLVLKPSPKNVLTATKFAKTLITTAGKDELKSLLASPAGKQGLNNLINVTVGGGVQGGQELVNQIKTGDYDALKVAAQTLLGTVINEPNRFGVRLGMKPTGDITVQEITPEMKQTAEVQKMKTVADMEDAKIVEKPWVEPVDTIATKTLPEAKKGVAIESLAKEPITPLEVIGKDEISQLQEYSIKAMTRGLKPTDSRFQAIQKGRAMEFASIRRMIDGKPTDIEFKNAKKYLETNYRGKQVEVDGKVGEVMKSSFGKIGVKFQDGTIKYVEPTKITSKKITDADVISYIKEQGKQKLETQKNIWSGFKPVDIKPEPITIQSTNKIITDIFPKSPLSNERLFIKNGNPVVALELSIRENNGGEILLNNIRTFEPNKGYATEALSQLKKISDETGYRITGTIKPTGEKILKTKELSEFYKKNGFEVSGKNITYKPTKIKPQQYQIGITNVKGFEPQKIDALVDKAKKLEAVGKFEEAKKSYEASLTPGVLAIKRLFPPNGVKIIDIKKSFGRYFGETEPTIYLKTEVKPEALNDFIQKVNNLSEQGFKQNSYIISRVLNEALDCGIINKEAGLSIEPSIDIIFDKKIGLDNLKELDILLNKYNLAGGTVKPDGSGLEIMNLSAYNTDYEKFRKDIVAFATELKSTGISAKHIAGLREVRHAGKEGQALTTYESIRGEVPSTSKQTIVDESKPTQPPTKEEGGFVLPKEEVIKPTGKTPSGVAKSLEANAIEKGLIDKGYDEYVGYDASTRKEQSQIASKYTPEEFMDFAFSVKPIPPELKPGTIVSVLQDYAMETNNVDIITRLSTDPSSIAVSEVSEAGSVLSLSRMIDKASPVSLIKDLSKERIKNAEIAVRRESGYKESPVTTKNKIKEQLRASSEKVKKQKYNLLDLFDELGC